MNISESFYSDDHFFVLGLCALLGRELIDAHFIIVDLDSTSAVHHISPSFLTLSGKEIVAFASSDAAYYKAEMFGSMTVLDKNSTLQDLLDFFMFKRAQSMYKTRRKLTPREKEVLSLMTCGKKSKEMASALGINNKTFYTHRKSLMIKLQCRNMRALQRFFIA
ncbi:helix-turn-helix transcriptional regulator [Pantoea sp. 1.19]|uniref:helix-turn-helix domain-containing protein n=1 Tax=Pantoea sp. 1.19 TaxID=1925589 RepID=UPI0009488CA3|nr:LuxR C-terminal-related transcriptional regulator [Pantoea sp. 1.19]